MSREIALVARAKGLAARLLSRSTLEHLAEAQDLDAFARDLARVDRTRELIGLHDSAEGHVPELSAIERAIERSASRYLHTLYRWQEQTPGMLDVLAADRDRRSLRALLRGAAQGAPAATRLDGVLPTPSLPRLALVELARQASPAGVVRQLLQIAHPDAPVLLPLVQMAQPDLFALEHALLQRFANRATLAATRSDPTLQEFVRELVDVGNAQNALLIAGAQRDVDPAACFVDGGRWVPQHVFVSVATSGSPHAALMYLSGALSRSPLASSLPVDAIDVARMDRAYLARTLARLARTARMDPLGSAPLLQMLLRLDAQCRDLRALAWGAALGTPPAVRRQHLVMPR